LRLLALPERPLTDRSIEAPVPSAAPSIAASERIAARPSTFVEGLALGPVPAIQRTHGLKKVIAALGTKASTSAGAVAGRHVAPFDRIEDAPPEARRPIAASYDLDRRIQRGWDVMMGP